MNYSCNSQLETKAKVESLKKQMDNYYTISINDDDNRIEISF
jgi:hypothetical protein